MHLRDVWGVYRPESMTVLLRLGTASDLQQLGVKD